MSTIFSKIIPFVALAAVVTCGTAASLTSASAAARPYYHPYAYHHSYGLQRYGYGYRRSYGGSGYARGPVYNHDDAHRLSRQTVGVGD